MNDGGRGEKLIQLLYPSTHTHTHTSLCCHRLKKRTPKRKNSEAKGGKIDDLEKRGASADKSKIERDARASGWAFFSSRSPLLLSHAGPLASYCGTCGRLTCRCSNAQPRFCLLVDEAPLLDLRRFSREREKRKWGFPKELLD